MVDIFTPPQVTGPLHGVRIWLSGSIPNNISGPQQNAMVAFVEKFAELVFSAGGHILHGSHPSIRDILLRVAKTHEWKQKRRDCLTLAVSRYWSKNQNFAPTAEWRQHCVVYETPEAVGDDAEQQSLKRLREWMSERCDVFVAIGGNWWDEITWRAGVNAEAGLAVTRGLPCFLLGGFGAAAQTLFQNHPEIVRSLHNGFDDQTNQQIATSVNVDELTTTIFEQLKRLPLVRGRTSDGISFRILALDGGGIKGAYTASVLAALEEHLGVPVSKHFDLITGTSTGGIIALGLGLGMSAAEIRDFYKTSGTTIFPMTRFLGRATRAIRHFFKPKHSQDVLRKQLEKAFYPGGVVRKLHESQSRLVIPAYSSENGACHVFRTPHGKFLVQDALTPIAEVAIATAAAPTYFSAARIENKSATLSYFDGGVWANCPAMAGIVEAVCYLDVSLDRIDVLSIGTTDSPFNVHAFKKSGILGWGRNLISLLMNAQVSSSIEHAKNLVGEAGFMRIDDEVAKNDFSLDNSGEIEKLIALGYRAGSDPFTLSQISSRFMNGIEVNKW